MTPFWHLHNFPQFPPTTCKSTPSYLTLKEGLFRICKLKGLRVIHLVTNYWADAILKLFQMAAGSSDPGWLTEADPTWHPICAHSCMGKNDWWKSETPSTFCSNKYYSQGLPILQASLPSMSVRWRFEVSLHVYNFCSAAHRLSIFQAEMYLRFGLHSAEDKWKPHSCYPIRITLYILCAVPLAPHLFQDRIEISLVRW